jgi:hypothetical protein
MATTTGDAILPQTNGAAKAAPSAAGVRKAAAAKKPAALKNSVAAKKPAAVKKAVAVKKPVAAKKAVVVKPAVEKKVAAKADKVKAAPKAESKEPAVPTEKVKKAKLVRDSFSMPEGEYAVLGAVKKACLKAGIEVKKSELLRIGVALIQKMDVSALKGVLSTLAPLKAGRPKQDK